MNFDEKTVTITDEEIMTKAICDLVDRTDCNFYYDAMDAIGYVTFNDQDACMQFVDEMTELQTIIDRLEYLYTITDDEM